MGKSEESTNITSSIANQNVCYAIIKGLENEHNLSAEMSFLRKNFFENQNQMVRIISDDDFNGFSAVTKGKLSNKTYTFKKKSDKIILEQVVKSYKSFIMNRFDLNGNLCGKVHYDSNLSWIKTEYFSLNDNITASHMIKPCNISDEVELYIYDYEAKRYNVINLKPNNFDDDVKTSILIALEEKDYCVFIEFQNERKIYLEKAVLDKINEKETDELKIEFEAEEELEPVIEETIDEVIEEDLSEFVSFVEIEENGITMNYTGKMLAGKAEGRGRTENENGITIFDGNYKKGLKNGFGCSYGENGNLKFAGFYNDDIKNGTGVSFREKDMAVHIANWNDGVPSEIATLFDKDGNLKFSGKITNENKTGGGVVYDNETEKIIVYKYQGDGSSPKEATVFDKDGNLLYSGSFISGKREGYGVEYNSNGTVSYEGEFKDDKYSGGVLHQQIT